MYIVFYSKFCKYSRKFIETLQSTQENQYFNKISVDDKKGKEYAVRNFNIKKVPTIIVNQEVFEGVEALKWIQKRIKSSPSNGNGSISSYSTRQNKVGGNNRAQSVPQNNGPILSAMEEETGAAAYNKSTEEMKPQYNNRIFTVEENDDVVEKTSGFRLSNDNITNGAQVIKPQNQQKSSVLENRYEELLAQRNSLR